MLSVRVLGIAKVAHLSSDTVSTGGVPTVKLGDVLDADSRDPTSNVNGSNIPLVLPADTATGVLVESSESNVIKPLIKLELMY